EGDERGPGLPPRSPVRCGTAEGGRSRAEDRRGRRSQVDDRTTDPGETSPSPSACPGSPGIGGDPPEALETASNSELTARTSRSIVRPVFGAAVCGPERSGPKSPRTGEPENGPDGSEAGVGHPPSIPHHA